MLCVFAAGAPGVVAEEWDGRHHAGGWSVAVEAGRIEVEGSGSADAWWTVVAAAGWAHLDATGDAPDVSGLTAPETQGGSG